MAVVLVASVLFFISGAAGLVYQVAWIRSLSLVFGGSHLAVTTVLAVFMGGLALGSRLLGRRADATARPLRLYGLLEIGVALSALAFLGVSRIFPSLYAPIARLAGGDPFALSAARVLLAALALIVPTTLMGGTLPVLTRVVGQHRDALGRRVSLLYAVNTLGAVAGALGAGFVLLRVLGVTATVLTAVAANLAVGLVSLALPEQRLGSGPQGDGAARETTIAPAGHGGVEPRTFRLVLWGIAVSGFCALGYEVLWTRMLAFVVGTSVYGFTIILVAFLPGIALGSEALGLVSRRGSLPAVPAVAAFGGVQVAIGLSALAVTILMRDLPSHAMALQRVLTGAGGTEFAARQAASFGVAFAYVLVPAFLGGVAFPLAATLHASFRSAVGDAVGEVLAWNTVGAILGSALSGFVLVYAFGIERSLQMLAVLNAGVGLLVLASLARRTAVGWAVGAAAAALLVALGADTRWGRFWDVDYFAVYRNNQRSAFDTAQERRDAVENTEVLYYHEGVNETISVVRPKGAMQALIVNGRPEATTAHVDVQCQRTLGHLPMLLHPEPRKVFVLGTGTGMTLGSTSVHPGVERIVLAEIEHGVIDAARTFADHNHGVLDDPRLEIVLNDGRNVLATTDEKFDVVTADPIHPWSGGAAYLYTREYFRSVADHLRPGGIACQWLPMYELTPDDLRSVVASFRTAFPHVMIWRTHYDAELVGSLEPIVIDEARLEQRIAHALVRDDLAAVEMGSAEDLLAYFVAADAGAARFAEAGVVNTDDNLHLEFSAPRSMGRGHLAGENVVALGRVRESLLPHLAPAQTDADRAAQVARWERHLEAARLSDVANAAYLGHSDSRRFAEQAWAALEHGHARFAPYRFLRREAETARRRAPTAVASIRLPVAHGRSGSAVIEVSAVVIRIGDTRAAVVLADSGRRRVFGERYLDAPAEALDAAVERFAADSLALLRAEYDDAVEKARGRGGALPSEEELVRRLEVRARAVTASGGR
jgi:spermidine synthase